jgi:hypothetical protein
MAIGLGEEDNVISQHRIDPLVYRLQQVDAQIRTSRPFPTNINPDPFDIVLGLTQTRSIKKGYG